MAADAAMLLTDNTIARLLAEPKPEVDAGALLHALNRSRPQRGHQRAQRSVSGDRGNEFHLHLRRGIFQLNDFSVILAYVPASGQELILRRHNGNGHVHRNRIEQTSFGRDVFHVHEATERYQLRGLSIDGFARATDEYDDLATALDAMLRVAGFRAPAQPSLWS
jgi:hypothetical protein